MKTLPVGLQLYTVRSEMEKDVAATLKAVKAAGYDYVEPAGLFGLTGEQFRALLDETGLKAICAHVALAEMLADTDKCLDTYKTIGCEYIAVPYLAEGQRPGDEGFDEVLKSIDKIGAACAAKGLVLVYHNHDFEFKKMPDGRYGLDYMYETISPEHLQTELDTCWVNAGVYEKLGIAVFYICAVSGRAGKHGYSFKHGKITTLSENIADCLKDLAVGKQQKICTVAEHYYYERQKDYNRRSHIFLALLRHFLNMLFGQTLGRICVCYTVFHIQVYIKARSDDRKCGVYPDYRQKHTHIGIDINSADDTEVYEKRKNIFDFLLTRHIIFSL